MVALSSDKINELEADLNNFDLDVRQNALKELLRLTNEGVIHPTDAQAMVNMHCHTFFSFNAYGHSPTSLAWLGKKDGFAAMGTVDFDVLDAVDEFLVACDEVDLRGSTGIETRVFLSEYADKDINSPGEPGVCYHMGIGFTSGQVPASVQPILDDYRQRASDRNKGLIERINPHLAPAAVDYEADVLPLSPGGTPTERHIVVAYVNVAEREVDNPAAFWAEKLDMPQADIEDIINDAGKFQNTIRKKLMKRGGIGYVQPGPETFPPIEPFNEMVAAAGALPCAAWLDGLSGGEQDMEALLNYMVEKGAVTFNIIPDRNWNIADSELKQTKVQKLYDVVKLAQKLDLPLNIGTEMNSFGQKLVDDFDAPELEPVRQAFLDGAHFIYGHTIMQRKFGMGYMSEWSKAQFDSRRERNEFYTKVGYAGTPSYFANKSFSVDMSPADILGKF